jgi:hypothetical protein
MHLHPQAFVKKKKKEKTQFLLKLLFGEWLIICRIWFEKDLQ